MNLFTYKILKHTRNDGKHFFNIGKYIFGMRWNYYGEEFLVYPYGETYNTLEEAQKVVDSICKDKNSKIQENIDSRVVKSKVVKEIEC